MPPEFCTYQRTVPFQPFFMLLSSSPARSASLVHNIEIRPTTAHPRPTLQTAIWAGFAGYRSHTAAHLKPPDQAPLILHQYGTSVVQTSLSLSSFMFHICTILAHGTCPPPRWRRRAGTRPPAHHASTSVHTASLTFLASSNGRRLHSNIADPA